MINMILFIVCILIFVSLIILTGISESVCDILQQKYNQSIFDSEKYNQQFWNPEISWNNKYVNGSKFKQYLFKTILVFTTDAWHLFKTLKTLSEYLIVFSVLFLMISPWCMILIILASKLLMKGIFELFHSKILIKKL